MQLNAERATVGRGHVPHLWENPSFVESRYTQNDENFSAHKEDIEPKNLHRESDVDVAAGHARCWSCQLKY